MIEKIWNTPFSNKFYLIAICFLVLVVNLNLSAASNDKIYLLWQDGTSPDGVSLSSSSDDGHTFSPYLSQHIQSSPSIAITEKNIFVAWQDTILDNREIFIGTIDNADPENDHLSTIRDISQDAEISSNPVIAAVGKNVYVIWTSSSHNLEAAKSIAISYSNNMGKSFSTSKLISSETIGTSNPSISVVGNSVYVVWETGGNIKYTYSNDGGNTFSTPLDISKKTGSSLNPSIAATGNSVYVVWQGQMSENTNSSIVLSYSSDGGKTFNAPKNISQNLTGFFSDPDVDVFNEKVYLTWGEKTKGIYADWQKNQGRFDIFLSYSSDGGKTFNAPKNISENLTGLFTNANIEVTAENIYVVTKKFNANKESTVLLQSGSQYVRFSAPRDLGESPVIYSNPSIAAAGNYLYIAWENNTKIQKRIPLSFSVDGGKTLHLNGNILNYFYSPLTPEKASIIASNKTIYMIWEHENEKSYRFMDIFISYSNDGGNTFNGPKKVGSVKDVETSEPVIAASGDNAYLLWVDENDPKGMFFSRSNNEGKTFSKPMKMVDPYVGFSNPEIAASGNNVYIVWEDEVVYETNETIQEAYEIVVSSSHDFGKSFDKPKVVSEILYRNGDVDPVHPNPTVATHGKDVYIVWDNQSALSETKEKHETLLAYSNDNGQTFNGPTKIGKIIQSTTGGAWNFITASQNSAYILWKTTDPTNLFLSFTNNSGKTFSLPKKIDRNPSPFSNDEIEVIRSSIASSGNNLCLIWNAPMYSNPDQKFDNIVFSCSKDGGKNFDFQRILMKGEDFGNPSIAMH